MKTINIIVEMLFQCLMGIVVCMPLDPIPFQQLNPLTVCLLPLVPPTPFHEQFSHNMEDPTICRVEDTGNSVREMPCIHEREACDSERQLLPSLGAKFKSLGNFVILIRNHKYNCLRWVKI